MCPDENTLTQFARGRADELPALEAHLDSCEKCRRVVAAAASETTLPGQKPSHELSPGLRVNRYEIERELGRGGMGVVYQARDVTLDRRVALKLLHARRDEAAQARLLREAQVMAKLAHPNVVPVFELGEWHSDLYLVMELVTGVTLEAWLKRAKHRRSDVINHFVQAGRGLAAAHASGVVHRDFKPANVLVGLDERVRVTDFGLSRPGPALELPATSSAVVTRAGAIVGTLAYMAPEQLDGKVADERSDQFAFCVSLAEALGGQRPFAGETCSELAVSNAAQPRFGAGIPSQLRSVLRKGLERRPSHRYASMTALLNAIERTQKTGWAAVGLTAGIALVVTGLISASQQPAPAAVTVQVVTAAVDLEGGTVITLEMLQYRSIPESFATYSVLKKGSAPDIIGQVINVPVKRGDALLWSQFERPASPLQPVLIAKGNLAEGTILTAELLEEHHVPMAMADDSVVTPISIAHVLGHPLTAALQRGDLLLWSRVASQRAKSDEPLTPEQVAAVGNAHREDFNPCMRFWAQDGTRQLRASLMWKVNAAGVPYDIEPGDGEPADDRILKCLVDAVATWKFPEGSVDTPVVEYSIELNR